MTDFDPTYIDALYTKVKAGGSQSAGYALARLAPLFQPGTPGPQPKAAILRLAEVKARTGLSRSTIYLHVAKGLFPRPVRLGPRAVGWPEAAIDDWLKARTANNSPPSPGQARK